MSTRRKSACPPGTFWVAEKPMRPQFRDGAGNPHPKLSEFYYVVVEMLSETLNEADYSENALREVNRLVPHFGQFYPRGAFATLRKADEAHIAFFNRMFVATQAAVEESYQRGVDNGKSLLLQLASGSITLKQFNQASTAVDGDE